MQRLVGVSNLAFFARAVEQQPYFVTGVQILMQSAQSRSLNGLSVLLAAIPLLVLMPNPYGPLLLYGQEIIGRTETPAELVNRLCVAQDRNEAAVGPQVFRCTEISEVGV